MDRTVVNRRAFLLASFFLVDPPHTAGSWPSWMAPLFTESPSRASEREGERREKRQLSRHGGFSQQHLPYHVP
ncbi:hypothetical protein B0J15DRAFT_493853 [Fusarium solani]|uniref:Secreted protein n=1 Tax=Fusarium solani TaxID=169388 RepID=A0A9P9HKP6_FUSSL|nr:uncharacterized protein B0J15DRAFT_493853 [Fusarium solani]KAH7258427.1 hypothetical protein B0J15DRAFT_493853 [Fusarium solani]